jgi:hypothetical protein
MQSLSPDISSIFNKIDTWIGCVINILAPLICLFSYLSFYEHGPSLSQMPIFLTPALTFWVAAKTFAKYSLKGYEVHELVDKNKGAIIMGVNIVAIFIIPFACFFLTYFHGPFKHIIYMTLLFGGFFMWDKIMVMQLKDIDKFLNDVNHIKSASDFINKPTIVAFVISLIYLTMSPWEGCEQNKKLLNEAFITGIISFHLIVSAVAYILGTFNGKQKWVKRLYRQAFFK